MPKGTKKGREKLTLAEIINKDLCSKVKLNELSADSLNLLNLLTLIVDIEYRKRYGESIDWQGGTGYSDSYNSKDSPHPIESDSRRDAK